MLKSPPYNYLLKYLLIAIISLFLTDAVLQGFYRITKKNYTWEIIDRHEVFKIDFLKPVHDERYLIPQKNYRKDNFATDENGFRIGKNIPSKTAKNIVFLGDSVPFGVNIASDKTVPSTFSQLVNERTSSDSPTYTHVINAAVPSYSLDQAVYHYIYDIKDKFPVSHIILQIYDPAANFYILGKEWDVTRNWYTGAAQSKIGFIRKYTNSPLRYSSLFYLYWRFSGAYFVSSVNLEPVGKQDVERYKASIIRSLDTLLTHTSNVNRIILLPINRPKSVMEILTPTEKDPIDILNELFQMYASTHPKVEFIDIREAFQNEDEEKIFIDTCCHLSAYGSYLQAKFLVNHLTNTTVEAPVDKSL